MNEEANLIKSLLENSKDYVWQRLLARLVDIILLLIFCFLGFLVILNKDISNFFNNLSTFTIPFWNMFYFSLLVLFAFLILQILVPFLTNGKTIGKKIFKLQIMHYDEEKSFITEKISLVTLLKRELFVTLIVSLLFCIMTLSWSLLSTFKIVTLSNGLKTLFVTQEGNTLLAIITGINEGFSLIMLVCFLSVFFSKTKQGIHDKFSHCMVVKPTHNFSLAKPKPVKLSQPEMVDKAVYNLPGYFNSQKSNELNQLIMDNKSKHE